MRPVAKNILEETVNVEVGEGAGEFNFLVLERAKVEGSTLDEQFEERYALGYYL